MFLQKRNIVISGFFLLSFFCCKEDKPVVLPSVLPVISVADISVPEGEEDNTISMTLKISGNREKEVSLSYQTQDGTAAAENDYVSTEGTLVFPVGKEDLSRHIDIKIIADKLVEEDEAFKILFSEIKNATIEKDFATISLSNDDEALDTFPGYTTPLEYTGMTLLWQDEFESDFSSQNWTPAIGTGCPNLCGWGNNELEYYRSENAEVSNGLLTITAREESIAGSDYTSARILTADKLEFRYGRVDIRVKLPRGKGIWPALWMLGANIDQVGWPECGEVDIMELRGSAPSRVCGTLHYKNSGGSHQNTSVKCHSLSDGKTYSDEFHVFSIIWDDKHIAWYMDDNKYNEALFANLNLGSKPNPFQKEFYFLLNLAVGGNYDGDPDDTTVFPQTMEVDYIRVFQEE